MNYEVFYFNKQVEIDFVVYSKRRVIELIQVCETLQDKKTLNREVRALINAFPELQPQALRIITAEEKSIIEKNGQRIEVIPVIKWLLEA